MKATDSDQPTVSLINTGRRTKNYEGLGSVDLTRIASTIHSGFLRYNDNFIRITKRSKARFERRDSFGAQKDLIERIELYDKAVRRTRLLVNESLGVISQNINLWDNVKLLNKQGVTIILTTHIMQEAQNMCDRIAILNKGNLITLDTTSNLLNRIKIKKIIFKVKNVVPINSKELNGIRYIYNSNNEITAIYERKKHSIDEVINKIKSAGMEIYDISTNEGDLEDVFIDLTKS